MSRRPKYATMRDAIEPEIVAALEAIGCTVIRMDVPVDLLVGYRKRCFLIECKSDKSISHTSRDNQKTKDQKEFFKWWRGQVRVCSTPEEAIRLVTRAYK